MFLSPEVDFSHCRILRTLVVSWKYVIVLLSNVNEFLELRGRKVGDSEVGEAALFVEVVDGAKCFFKRCGCVGGVEVVDVNLCTRTEYHISKSIRNDANGNCQLLQAIECNEI